MCITKSLPTFSQGQTARGIPGRSHKTLACQTCERPITVAIETVAATCRDCLTRVTVRLPDKPLERVSAKARALVRGECASFDKGHGECLMIGTPCAVFQGGRCTYFERCVLPLAADNPKDFAAAAKGYAFQVRAMGFRTMRKRKPYIIKRKRASGKTIHVVRWFEVDGVRASFLPSLTMTLSTS